MKRKIITCDICGSDIADADTRLKFKKYRHFYADYIGWRRCDMCIPCYWGLCTFVKNNRKRKDDDNAVG